LANATAGLKVLSQKNRSIDSFLEFLGLLLIDGVSFVYFVKFLTVGNWYIPDAHTIKFLAVKQPVTTGSSWPDVDDECVKNLKL
jgi:hypothetical protein